MKVLSIQSAVAYGHVGNSAAVFPLQRIGVEVLPVYTVNFSNHTGYGAWRGPLISPDDVRDVILGIEERGVFPQIDAVLSGYQGGEGIGDVILDAVARVKAADLARGMGPRTVLVTSVERPDREPGTIEMLVVNDVGAWIVQTPLLPMKANGSGDVTAALFTAHYLRTGDAADALARTVSSVFDLLQRTHESGERELRLVESQEFYANPRLQFEVPRVR